jgi:hypothetical protein
MYNHWFDELELSGISFVMIDTTNDKYERIATREQAVQIVRARPELFQLRTETIRIL